MRACHHAASSHSCTITKARATRKICDPMRRALGPRLRRAQCDSARKMLFKDMHITQ
jgi:hypothetical protein